jgi:hypothetical protein
MRPTTLQTVVLVILVVLAGVGLQSLVITAWDFLFATPAWNR